MSDESQASQAQEQTSIDSLPVNVHAQYIKDLSFENPGAPFTFKETAQGIQTGVDFGMEARKIEGEETENLFEVILTVRAETKKENLTIFLAEISYGSLVSLKDVAKEQEHPLLLIEVPRLSFPFVRQIVNDLALQGGYPPMLLHPVNFHQLYMDRFVNKDQNNIQSNVS